MLCFSTACVFNYCIRIFFYLVNKSIHRTAYAKYSRNVYWNSKPFDEISTASPKYVCLAWNPIIILEIVDLLPEGVDRERCECRSTFGLHLQHIGALKIIINVLKTSEEEVTKNVVCTCFMKPSLFQEMINQALLINSKLDGRRSDLDKLSLFIRSGPCLKIPRRSVGKRPLNRHLFLVRWPGLFPFSFSYLLYFITYYIF